MKLDPNEFDEVLAKALKRVDAPEGFADRVMARAAMPHTEKKGKLLVMPRVQAWMSGAIAAALLLGVFVGERVHVEHVRKAAAIQEFDTATRITDKALEHAREQMQRAGVSLDQ